MRKSLISAASVAVIAGVLAGCQPVPPAAPEPLPPSDECNASAYQGLVGQPRKVLEGMTFPLDTRVIGPSDAVTADYRPDRLNIEYSAGGLIEKISCY